MNIAIIEPNDVSYSEHNMMHQTFTYEKVEDLLTDHIEFKKVNDHDDMMKVIIAQVVNNDPDFPIHTAIVSNVLDELYMMCHIYPTKEIYEEFKAIKAQFNGIASYLTDMNLKLYQKAVIFKINTKNNQNKLESISMGEIVNLFTSKFVHKGVLLNLDGTLDELKFIFNPVDWIGPNEVSNYMYNEIELLGKVFMLFADTKSNVENRNASVIFGQKINGRVILAMRDKYVDMNETTIHYTDLDCPTARKLIKLCSQPNKSIELAESENYNLDLFSVQPEAVPDEQPKPKTYNNFHKVLASRVG